MKFSFLKCIPFTFFFTPLFPLFSWAETQIALNWKAEPQFGGFYQAQLNQDVSMKLIEGGSGTPTIQMLTFKKVDYAVVSAEEILISNEKNPKNQVVAVFAVFQTNPQILMTPASRPISNIQELLLQPGLVSAQTGLTYVEFLKKKYPQAQVKWVPYLGGITGLLKEKDYAQNYAQQGFLTSEPLIAEKKGLSVKTFLIADEGFNPYTTVLAVRKADLSSRKAEIETVVRAIRKGWKDYLENPSPANQLMASLNKSMDLESFQKSAVAQKPLIAAPRLGEMTEARWKSLVSTLRDLKVLKKDLKASEQFMTFQ